MKKVAATFLEYSALIFLLNACAHSNGISGKTYTLAMKGLNGEVQLTRYFSHARIRNFEEKQMTRDKQEMVDFVVRTQTVGTDPQTHEFLSKTKTVYKDGTVSLHELAFPELLEEIDFIISKHGKIVHAGNYPPDSLFFVPFMPIPKSPVEIGETWTMQHTWISSPSGIPLELDIVAILKRAIPCGNNQTCLDIEISGNVLLAAKLSQPDVKFNGKVWGRLLFNLDRGDVIRSETRSAEEMVIKGERVHALSCLRAERIGTASGVVAIQALDSRAKPSPRDGFKCTPSEN